MLKFRKAANSANDVDEAYYVSAADVIMMETAATTVVVHVDGRKGNAVPDTITITCGAGSELAIADKIAKMMATSATVLNTDPMTIGVELNAGITTIAYAVV